MKSFHQSVCNIIQKFIVKNDFADFGENHIFDPFLFDRFLMAVPTFTGTVALVVTVYITHVTCSALSGHHAFTLTAEKLRCQEIFILCFVVGRGFLCFCHTLLYFFSLAACAGTTPDTPSGTTPSNGSQTTNGTNDTKNPDSTTSGEDSTTGTTDTTDSTDTPDTPAAGGKTLVVYFSGSGNTKRVAEDIAAATGGTLFELVPVTPYTSADLSWTTAGSRVNREHDDESLRDIPLVTTTPENFDEYDTVFIGYPIWWGIAAWPVNNFVKNNDFSGKTVIPFATSASSGMGQSGSLLAEMAGTGNWQEGHRFSSGASKSTVEEWGNGLK